MLKLFAQGMYHPTLGHRVASVPRMKERREKVRCLDGAVDKPGFVLDLKERVNFILPDEVIVVGLAEFKYRRIVVLFFIWMEIIRRFGIVYGR